MIELDDLQPDWTSDDGNVVLFNADCLDILPQLPDGCVDAVVTDPPYGTTACKWDQIIPLNEMWTGLRHVTPLNSAVVLTASQPFTSVLIASNLKAYKHSWRWVKPRPSNPQLAKKAPLKYDEDVCCFSFGSIPYNPQGLQEIPESQRKVHRPEKNSLGHCQRKPYIQTHTGYPNGVLEFAQERGIHPTQKPVPLMAYLIKTYSEEGGVVLDFCLGSGTTAVACVNTGRKCIGIEKEPKYFDIAVERVKKAYADRGIFAEATS